MYVELNVDTIKLKDRLMSHKFGIFLINVDDDDNSEPSFLIG
jgi:hypothetical protein